MRKLCGLAATTAVCWALMAGSAFACGGLVAPNGAVRLEHTVTLAAYPTALVARLTRSSLLEILRQDYVRTSRAKGLAERTVVLRHALRNATIPVLTVIGLQIGTLLGGAVITESVFAWPGIGKLVVDAIFFRDFPVVQTILILSASIFIGINLLVDLLYVVIDPRIRYG